ncbi:MAG: beta-glucosidase family protein [Promethearchaeota archaeon]
MNSKRSQIFNWNELKNKNLSDEEIDEKARQILDMMDINQKVNQMSGDGNFITGGLRDMIRYNAKPIKAGADKKLDIPAICFSDGPRGVVMDTSTCFPVSMARGASWDIDLEEKIGEAIGIEAKIQGANFFGGVCINLLRHPAWGRAQETYGEDPYLLGEMGAALTRGVQKHIMACIKHFAANSMENARFKVDVQMDEKTLREVYLPHFKRCIEEGAASVMSAYNKLNGEYCSHNYHLLTEVLRNDWNFRGFVITDFVLAVRNGVKGVNAGIDIEMPYGWRMRPKKLLKYLKKKAITEEQINSAVLNILRQKIRFYNTIYNFEDILNDYKAQIEAKYDNFSFDDFIESNLDFSKINKKNLNIKTVSIDPHRKLALESAEKGIVLLKNEDNLLPIRLNKTEIVNKIRIGVLGELADIPNIGDKGSSKVYPPYVVTPLKGIQNYIEQQSNNDKEDKNDKENKENSPPIELRYFKDYKEFSPKHKENREFLEQADYIIIVVGNTYKEEGEFLGYVGGDRDSLELKAKHELLIKKAAELNNNIIVLIESGSAIIVEPWKNMVKSLLMVWYPGMEGGNAIANILFGKVNPSGKLPFSVPKSSKDLPFFDKKAKSVRYDYLHGYRHFDTLNIKPAYHFGYGLHYTRIEYDKPKYEHDKDTLNSNDLNDEIKVSISLKNVGDLECDEITQLYVGKKIEDQDNPRGTPNSTLDKDFPALKYLKKFKRVHLDKNEVQSITFVLKTKDIQYFNTDSNKWDVKKGKYTIFIGPSSDPDDLQVLDFQII